MSTDPAIVRWIPLQRPLARDGRGRYLPLAWIARAETYTPEDLAWFRSPLR